MNAMFLAPMLAAGVITSAARADLWGLIANTKRSVTPGLVVCNVYACFDGENDRLLGVSSVKIRTRDGADFWQHTFGEETAPAGFLLPIFPDLIDDTFVTIGVKNTDEAPGGVDGTTLDKDYLNLGNEIFGGWFNNDPDNGQGDAANYSNGYVLIGQFTIVGKGLAVESAEGIVTIHWQGDATGGAIVEDIFGFGCSLLSPPVGDLDNDFVVGPADLAILLGAWGPCVTDSCWADIDHDGDVGPIDLAILLGDWG